MTAHVGSGWSVLFYKLQRLIETFSLGMSAPVMGNNARWLTVKLVVDS